MLKIDSVLTLRKRFDTRVKKCGEVLLAVCELKFTACPLQREAGDELLGTPIGWITTTHYDELGAPLRPFTLKDKSREFQVSGTISGNPNEGRIALVSATLGKVEVGLDNNQVLVGGVLSWEARGDEVEDLAPLLGKTCKAELQLTWQEQERLPLTRSSADGSAKFSDLMSKLKGADPQEGADPS